MSPLVNATWPRESVKLTLTPAIGNPVAELVTVPEIRPPGVRTKLIPVMALFVTTIGVNALVSQVAEHGTLL